MLDRALVEEFLDEEFEDSDWGIPEDIPKNDLVETFALYVEDDLGDWLDDNFKSFFNADPDWDLIRAQIKRYKREQPH